MARRPRRNGASTEQGDPHGPPIALGTEASPGAGGRLSLRFKLLYGIGDVANAVKMVLFGLFTLYFYTTVMGLPARLVGIASGIGLLWDAIIDPYIGHLTDRFPSSPLGRRHPLMFLGALAMGPCFWAFFSPPVGLSTWWLFLWLLATGLAVRTMTSLYGVPYYALGAELTTDYYERTQITGIRSAWALTGTLAAAVLPFVLFLPDLPEGTHSGNAYGAYRRLGMLFGGLMTASGLLSTVATVPWRGGSGPRAGQGESEGPEAFFHDLARCLKNRSFRLLFASFSLFFLGVVLSGALSMHFLTYYIQVQSGRAIGAFQLSFYLGALLGTLFWTPASKRLEKKSLYIFSMLMTALLLCCAYLLFGEGHLFGVGNLRVLSAGNAGAGFFASILWILPASMIADITDEEILSTGRRREGAFFGIFLFGQQVAAGLSLLLAGILAQDFAGLQAGPVSPSPVTVKRLAIAYGPVPALLLAVGAGLVIRYSLTRERVAALQGDLGRGPGKRNGSEANNGFAGLGPA